MKKLILLFFILFSFVAIPKNSIANENILFYGNGCKYCAKVEDYFNKNNIFEKYSISKKEIYSNRDNARLYNQINDQNGISLQDRGVPLLYLNGHVYSGANQIINFFENRSGENSPELCKENSPECDLEKSSGNKLTLPVLIGAAAVDAINPCEFAILILLMANILAAGNRKRDILKVGFAFVAAIYISYYLMGFGIYHAVSSLQLSSIFTQIIGILALVLGLANLKDFFWYGGGGFLMEVPMRWRPKMNNLVRSIASPIGAAAIGFLVSLFLLPCTSGPYIVILGMLGGNASKVEAASWLALYNLIFVLPMIFIILATALGLKPEKADKIRKKNLRLLHLIAAILMIGMGLVILFEFI